MNRFSFERHLNRPRGRGPVPEGAVVGSAGGAPCGDLVRIALRVTGSRVEQATFDAEGCGATIAAASACMELVEGAPLLEAAGIGRERIAAELGGLSQGKAHAADLAADALHRSLTSLWRSGGEPRLDIRRGRVLVAVSGGVDSAVAALLARDAGHEVVAVTLKLWADAATDGTRSCCSPQAVISARALAHSMGLPHLTLDLEDRFRRAVVEDFLDEHDRGRTPNPCVRCNGIVRFDSMLALAERIGAEALLTGHYARIEQDGEGPLLARAADTAKDQSYMLAALSPELLARVRFPLGALTKPEVRRLARAAGLAVAEKKESQDLCFMAGTTREAFLERHASAGDRPGEIVDRRGRSLGRHRGHRHFTVGQRRGLGVAAGEPLYVLAKDAGVNRVVVGTHGELATGAVELAPGRLYREGARVDRVRLRYRSGPVPCSLEGDPAAGEHASLAVRLHEPVHGVAAGQSACLMRGERVLGHGTIAHASPWPEGRRAAALESLHA
jgi:tRNA-uridine 2-sulfurtransferase